MQSGTLIQRQAFLRKKLTGACWLKWVGCWHQPKIVCWRPCHEQGRKITRVYTGALMACRVFFSLCKSSPSHPSRWVSEPALCDLFAKHLHALIGFHIVYIVLLSVITSVWLSVDCFSLMMMISCVSACLYVWPLSIFFCLAPKVINRSCLPWKRWLKDHSLWKLLWTVNIKPYVVKFWQQ